MNSLCGFGVVAVAALILSAGGCGCGGAGDPAGAHGARPPTPPVAATAPAAAATAPAWEQEAFRRIDRYRRAALTVRVVDAAGRPLEGAEVVVRMQRHAFGFGTAVNADLLAKLPEDDPYKVWIPRLFNQATLNNRHKWKMQERQEDRLLAAQAVQWLSDHGLAVHGHTMIWGSYRYTPVPPDVLERARSDAPDRAYLRRRSLEHIDEIGRRLHGDVIAWDVVNEPVAERLLQAAIDPDAQPGREPILVAWFNAARRAEPDVPLYLNEYHIVVGDFPEQKDTYEATIRYLLDQGAPLGGIGVQCHFYRADLRRTPGQMLATLDRFGRFGLPIHISEFDTFGPGWGHGDERREVQAAFLREMMIVAFSHPRVTALTLWNFWDGRHWAGEAPLFYKDWTPKPALDVYRDLVFGQWWTGQTCRTDAAGQVALRGFLGDYAITAAADGHADATVEATLDADGEAVTVTLP